MSDPNQRDPARGQQRSRPNAFGRILGSVVPTVVDAMDVDDVLERVDVDQLIARIDVDALVNRVDIDALVNRVDIEALVNRVDVDTLVGKVDIDALIERVDLNALVDRVDIDRLVERLDLDLLMDRIDIDKIVQRADLAGIVSQSTRSITATSIDLARRQVAGVDEIVTRVATRLVGRDPASDPTGPPALRPEGTPAADTREERGAESSAPPSISGHYAGPLARLAAFSIDGVALAFLFGVFTAVGRWTVDLIAGDHETLRLGTAWSAALLTAWSFLYFAVPLAVTGRTLGKAAVGLRIVRRDGTPLRPFQAVVRVLVLPVSLASFGLGLIGGVIGRHRRTLHDLVAGSAEVIDWGDRPAALPGPLTDWLARRQHADSLDVPTPD